ncbi:cytochrome c biogenesis protein CcsA [Anatilimnocola floriformis]|uniref:cytochrome c biogenesis protein CcsA n=1 Tax=Anatilimnocola floriformis TaxID=2948575 RepID=UPI0020C2FFC2|nr:cytochrome c biogenesis protein CcsA [Anatilimnocola floriformis]
MSVAASKPVLADGLDSGRPMSTAAWFDWFLAPLASQKIAVAMFAYGIFVVLVGTLAQVDKDIWQVVPEYFRAWIMRVDINVFFPPSFFPNWKRINLPPIPMPGGMFVGVTMILNMLFAHARWVLQLKTKMSLVIGGLGLIAFGWLITLLLILAGHNSAGFQTNPPFSWDQFWIASQVTLIGVWVSAVFCYFWFALQPIFRSPKVTMLRGVLVAIFGFLLAGLSFGVWYVLFQMDNPGAEGLRIVWQLLKGTFAGVILLPGCWLLFQKRGGIVLLHQGMLLLMLNELFVARYAVEYNMALTEGQTANYLRDIRSTELALIDRSGKEKDEHFVVPMQDLLANAELNDEILHLTRTGSAALDLRLTNEQLAEVAKKANALTPIPDPNNTLPVKVFVLQYVRNADLRKLKADENSLATQGIGKKQTIVPRSAAKGTDSEGSVDLGAAYVRFTDKKSNTDLGTYLIAQAITETDDPAALETVDVSGKPYLAALRFKRQFLPFTVQLKDVKKDDYVASNTPRNYSSDVLVKDPTNGVDSTVHIKMNDPLRYSGMTLYQSNYARLPSGVEHSTLAVVQNVGWMIPYVALMIITVGMIAHFLSTLIRFLRRRENEEIAAGDIIVADVVQPQTAKLANQRKAKANEIKPLLKAPHEVNWTGILLAVAASTIIFAMFLGMALRSKSSRTPQLDYEAFGKLAVAGNGRVMPFDSHVRNMLLQFRQRETAKTREGQTISVTQWFLDLISGSPATASHLVFKIDNPEVQKVFELDEKRQGHVYSTAELFPKIQEFENQVRAARQKPKEELTVTQRKLMLMDGQLTQYMTLVRAFNPPQLPPLPEQGDAPDMVQRKILAFKQAMMESSEMLEQAKPPLAIPLPNAATDKTTEAKWQSFHNAWIVWFLQTNVQNQPGDPATEAFINIIQAYRKHSVPRDAWQADKLELTELGSKKGIAARKKRLEEDLDLLKRSSERQRNTAEEIQDVEKQIKQLDDVAFVARRLKELPNEIKLKEKEVTETIEPFNLAVSRFDSAVERTHPPEYNRRKIDLEVWMNRVSPFYVGMQLYIVAFLLAVFGWLIPSRSCNWAAFTLVFLTFVLHTAALAMRIYISGRPPVTNLYSSAVFIGWFAVLVGMVIELVFRIGLGNLVSTIAGFATLIIAYFLGMSGDTIGVMQAVLDTQFWLATHVVCITVGYASTFLAGFLGVLYVVLGVCTPGLTSDFRRICARMIYGVVCFAMFFSFVGTVLGGLWADDSWGRFWGWDPKENGALIIVLWNALILHAKWDKMVGERGLALLAIGGNIVTAWSWFGVNELGVGLHSYGFTEGVLRTLLVFVASQLALITLGAGLPLHMWWSVRSEEQHRGALGSLKRA